MNKNSEKMRQLIAMHTDSCNSEMRVVANYLHTLIFNAPDKKVMSIVREAFSGFEDALEDLNHDWQDITEERITEE